VAEDAIWLCNRLTDGTSGEECRGFVADMLDIATKAHKLSQGTSKQFGQIRVKLLQVILFEILLDHPI